MNAGDRIDQPPEVVYTPESQLRHPGRLLRAMFRDLIVSRELAWRLLVRNISVRYRQSALGYLWAFLPPILTSLVFVLLSGDRLFRTSGTDIPYPLFVLVGTVFWQAFVDALRGPVKLVITSKMILTKVNFPREALVLASIGEVIFDLIVRSALFIPMMIWYEIDISPMSVAAMLPVVTLILLGTIIGVFLAPLAILLQDVEYGLTMVFSVWFFLTPVVYTVPAKGFAARVIQFNPVTPLLVSARDCLILGDPGGIGIGLEILVVCVVVSTLSWLSFRLVMPRIIERVGS